VYYFMIYVRMNT